MPLVRIDLRRGASSDYRKAIADAVHRALIDAIAIPFDDRFQVIHEHDEENFIYDPQYMGIHRSGKVIFIQITMSNGRKPSQKRALFRRLVELLAQSPGIRPEDVFINLVEVAWENWSFGLGEAQYTKD